MSERVETAVRQYLRLSRLHAAGDISPETVARGLRVMRLGLTTEEWAQVKYEAFAREIEAAGWKVTR